MNKDRIYRIKRAIQATKARRDSMTCKVFECKIDSSSLNQITKAQLKKLFLEGKWLYNAILGSPDLGKFDTKVKQVQVKVLDKFENRELENISSQMKQGIQTRIFNALSTLKALKEKGYRVGALRFKREMNCIPLKQYGNTYLVLKKQNKIRIQGIKQLLRVRGLDQLPKEFEYGNANLIKVGNDYYVKITIFEEPKKVKVPDKTIGIDFGCETQLTLSNGEKIRYQVPVSPRIKKLDQKIARSKKKSKEMTNNRRKALALRQKEYNKLNNKRKEIKNQIVHKLVSNYKTICFQDESIRGWKASGHGKKIQFSAIGGIITALQRKAVTPVVVNKFFPSSQLCSKCGHKQKMKQEQRTYLCPSCGARMDRDVNAAINIEKEGIQNKKVSSERGLKPVESGVSTVKSNNIRSSGKHWSKKQEAHEFIRG